MSKMASHHSSPGTLAGSAADDVVNTEDHLRGLRGVLEGGGLGVEGLGDTRSLGVEEFAGVHVDTHARAGVAAVGLLEVVYGLLLDTGVLGEDEGDLHQRVAERLHRELLAGAGGAGAVAAPLLAGLVQLPVDGGSHEGLGGARPVHDAGVAGGALHDAQRIAERAVRLVQDLLRAPPQHDGARVAPLQPREADDGVLTDHDLVDHVATTQAGLVGGLELRHDLTAEGEGETLHTVEVGVLDGHHAALGEHLLGVVVDELAVDEHVAPEGQNALHLRLHLLLLRLLDVCDSVHRVNLNARPEDLDLVGVHRRVGNQNLTVLHHLGLTRPDLLVKEETGLKGALLEGATQLLHDADKLKVAGGAAGVGGVGGVGLADTHNSVDSEHGEVLLESVKHLRGQGGAGHVEEVAAEELRLVGVVCCTLLQRGARDLHGAPPAVDDDLGVDLLDHDQVLSLPQKLSREDAHGGGTVANLLVLCLRDVDEDLGSGVVHVDRLQNRRPVVRHVAARAVRAVSIP
eukprot:Hpha_TRINITY_DN16078_c0_g1::TRINITY_DN16078_c0_g1_i1::g.117679::m.117679